MKQKDIALIIVVSAVSAVFALLLSNYLIGTPESRQQKAEKVDKITTEFKTPDKKYFNEQSIDPTQLIRIGDNANNTPFNGN